ncbi:amidase [Microbacterium proteolyticum]|uniref:Amidase n=1 Tax=Microbacterium proteolyticum TaxID=1572644 RepID=A0A7W5GFE9_9MICO|nr:amidase [Microbacterium proteolyticum]
MDTAALTVVEADIDRLRAALEAGEVTSVELVARYLNRIGAYDRSGIRLNAVPVLNPRAFDEARAADLRRSHGEPRGPLDGIPFTAKDSYRVEGLPVASGSPAFRDLIAQDDAFAVERLRAAGAVFLGLTNMPPMAAGGMQRGVYGRAESPYNGDYLPSAFGSGSSNGSGTATAASFAAFGLGEETWSSGRAPASHNALVAYTPSRGVISIRGNWPLVPTMDVVVPHTRSMRDLQFVLDAVVADDPVTDGDLWRTQPWIALPRPSEVRPESFVELEPLPLAGLRLAVPRIYVNGDPDNASPIATRASVMRLWADLRADLQAAGAEVIETDFPVVDRYEKLHPGDEDFLDRGFVTRRFLDDEVGDLAVWAMDAFLRHNDDPALNRLADVDAAQIFPHPPGALPDCYGIWHYDISYDIGDYVRRAKQRQPDWREVTSLEEGLRGLEHTRRVDFEEWMEAGGFDAVIFPTQSDVGPADADRNPDSADIAWRNGVWVSNGNLVPRHLGIPTVTVPMGTMDDTGMPVGLTIAGPAYSDVRLVQLGSAITGLGERRTPPPRTPALADEALFAQPRPAADGEVRVDIDEVVVDGDRVRFTATVRGGAAAEHAAYVDGVRVALSRDGDRLHGSSPVTLAGEPVSEWIGPYGPLVVIAVRDDTGAVAGAVATASSSPL